MMKIFNNNLLSVITLLLATCVNYSRLQAQIFNIEVSALADGQLLKLAIAKSGVYKITKKNLDDYGVNSNNVNPQNIKIYTNYGGTLPESMALSYPDDLIELPIFVNGEGDGKMNDADYILFYADGGDKLKINPNNNEYYFDKNIYDNNNYVFLKISETKGKRINKSNIQDGGVTFTTDKYINYQIFTEDKTNLLGSNLATNGSGKLWVGEYLVNNQERDYTSSFDFTNIVKDTELKIEAICYGRSASQSKISLNFNGTNYESKIDASNLNSDESVYAKIGKINQTLMAASTNPKVSIKHIASSGGDAWLDYIFISNYNKISFTNSQLFIRHPSFTSNVYSSLDISGSTSNLRIWDITKLDQIQEYEIKNNKANVETGSTQKQFILFNDNTTLSPAFVSSVKNQNLHSIKDAELIILYPDVFKEAAEKLAAHRISYNKYKTSLVNINDVYNEFASGKKDVTAIRNLAKMVHDRNPNFKYLLLFGDGSYDYRNLVIGIPDHNFIPVYETNQSLDPINAFPTDDYYALLGNNEGATLDGTLDISVGRLTITTPDEASALVQKIIDYDVSPNRFGEWRLTSSFSADDEDSNTHLRDADFIAEKSLISDPLYNQQKIYFDAFIQENTPGGQRYDDATELINQNMNKGLLTWCYLGHGGPKGLAQERTVKISDITSWNNYHSPALMVTATCSFTGYDDPSITSGGEEALLNPKGGAIALFTTTRPVYANLNKELTDDVYKNIYKKINGKNPTFGEIMTSAKNQDLTNDNTRKFGLIGDPSQQLALPEHNIIITTINDIPADSFTAVVGALEKIVFKGKLEDYLGSTLSDFNGELSMTIYDKISSLKTLANDPSKSSVTTFKVYKNIIFKGKAEVKNGFFTIECIIPKDINYEQGYGRISMYAHNNVTDAAGQFSRLIIGGSTTASVTDNIPPKMNVYMNDDNFIKGGITNSNPSIYLSLEDDLGINITGNSIGHDITAKLKGDDVEEEFILNDFYKANTNSSNKGIVLYPLSKLKSGKYTVTAKAWDISNNSVEGSTEFYVIDGGSDKLSRVYNYPNPFTTNTNFNFEHDLAGQNLEVLIHIYTISGKLVTTLTNSQFSTGFRGNSINWSGKDDFGSNLARGVYLYKIIVKAEESGLKRESDFMKMVKI